MMYQWQPNTCPVCGASNHIPVVTVKDRRASREDFDLGKCRECGLVMTLDAPAEDDISRYYRSEDYVSHTDTQKSLIDKLYHLARSWMLIRKRRLIRKYHPVPGSLLDFGSGTGYFIHTMSAAGWDASGMEPDATARAVALNHFGFELQLPDLGMIRENSFDVITLWHVLEHLHRPNASLKAFSKGLKKGGTLILALPNIDAFDARHYGKYWDAYDVPRHLWHFNYDTLTRLLSRHGLHIENFYTMPFDVFYIAIRSEKHKNAGLPFLKGVMKAAYWSLRAKFDKKKSSALVYIVKSR